MRGGDRETAGHRGAEAASSRAASHGDGAPAGASALECLLAAGAGADVAAARDALNAFLAAPPAPGGPGARSGRDRPAGDGQGAVVLPMRRRNTPTVEAS